MPVMVKTLGFLSHNSGRAAGGIRKLTSHLKYLEYGKIHENQPKGFTRDGDCSRADFMDKVMQQPERGVIAHKLVFSLSQDERDRLGVNLKDVVRDTMSAWESKLGRPLNWVGFVHEDQGHPHVHVVVGGYAGDRQVGVYPRDLDWMRKTADRSKESLARGRDGELSPTQEASRLMRQVNEQVRERSRFFERLFERSRGDDRGR